MQTALPRLPEIRQSRAAGRRQWRSRAAVRVMVTTLTLLLCGCARHAPQPWQMQSVDGHLPDLRFTLTDDLGQPFTQENVRGRIALVLFGYTHCPDICPTTLAKLSQVLTGLGPQADNVRILFISVDPLRDSPATMHAYVRAFDARHAIGLSGPAHAIEALAKRYRVAYSTAQTDPGGQYEVTHSGAVYVFDRQGHARLIAGIDAPAAVWQHDLRLLLNNDCIPANEPPTTSS